MKHNYETIVVQLFTGVHPPIPHSPAVCMFHAPNDQVTQYAIQQVVSTCKYISTYKHRRQLHIIQ